jgi:hypothetical protein
VREDRLPSRGRRGKSERRIGARTQEKEEKEIFGKALQKTRAANTK